MASQNDVNRAARDIGIAVIEMVKTRAAQAATSGELRIEPDQLERLIAIIDAHGQLALQGAFRSFMATLDKHAKEREDGQAALPKA